MRVVNETMSAKPTARGSGSSPAPGLAAARASENSTANRPASAASWRRHAVHQLRLEHGREVGEPLEHEQARAGVVELVPRGHVLDEGLGLPERQALGRVADGA